MCLTLEQRLLHDYSRKRNEKNIYYLNTNNVKRLLQELISKRNAYKMVFFGRGCFCLVTQ